MKNPINCIRSFLQDKPATNRLLLYFLITLIFFGAFCKLDFATDTYADILADYSEIAGNFLRCGRIFTAGLYTIFHFTHLDIRLVSFASFALAILSLTFALYILEKLLRENFIKNNFWSFILPILIIINPFIIELFLFVEKGLMCLSILCCVISAYYFNSYLNSRSRKDLLKILIINLVATILYQGTIGIFIILSVMTIMMRAKTLSYFVKYTIIAGILYLIAPLFNFLLIKLFFASGRTSGGIDPIATGKAIFENIHYIFNLFHIISPLFFWGCLLLASLCYTYYFLKKHYTAKTLDENNTNKPYFVSLISPMLLLFLKLGLLFVIILLSAIAPQIAVQSDNVWLVPRSTYPFASALGVSIVLIIHATQLLSIKPHNLLLPFSILCLLAAQFYSFNRIILNHYTISEIDRLRAQKIGRIITDYEVTHNLTIINISPAPDQYLTYAYPGISTLRDSNISSFNTAWSDVASINYWNDRNFTRLEPSEEWKTYCGEHEWMDFNFEQLKFSGDTLYLCLY